LYAVRCMCRVQLEAAQQSLEQAEQLQVGIAQHRCTVQSRVITGLRMHTLSAHTTAPQLGVDARSCQAVGCGPSPQLLSKERLCALALKCVCMQCGVLGRCGAVAQDRHEREIERLRRELADARRRLSDVGAEANRSFRVLFALQYMVLLGASG
jgi:hypothetical protein